MPSLISVIKVPIGAIASWSGLISDIPHGWQLCDGTNGTPDLRGKFIRGAPSSTEAGTIGGQDTVTLTTAQIPSHTHGITDPGHTHKVQFNASNSGSCTVGNHSQTNSLLQVNAAFTGITIASTGGGLPHNNLPVYYQVAFIYKMSEAS